MRIITGTARGRRLQAPKGDSTRPMLDAQKEMVFSMLGARVLTPGVLDVFAGTGGLGLECLSRGAEHAVFIERGREALLCLNANIDVCGLRDRSVVLPIDAFRIVPERLPGETGVVFVDPPFPCFVNERARLEALMERLAAAPAIPVGATFVWRMPSEATPIALPRTLPVTSHRSSGRSEIFFLTKAASENPSSGAG